MTTSGEPTASDGPPELVALPAHSSAERLRLLLRLSETLAATKDADEVAAAFTDIALQYLGATFGGVAVVDGDAMHYLTLLLLPDPVRRTRQSFPLASSRPAAMVTREQRALFLGSRDAMRHALDVESLAAVELSGGESVAYLPMLLGSGPVGAIVLMWDHEVAFGEDDRRVMWALARYTAQAMERSQLLADRRAVAHTLQAALLPVLPSIGWIEMAGEYRPASSDDMVGGDWYDAFISVPAGADRDSAPTPETLTICVGDVTGHDTHAAAEMGRLQAKLRALAIDVPALPHRLLERLERVMTANVHNRLATAVTANLTPRADGQVDMAWSNAGHLPPLVVEPGAAPYYLERQPQPLLGLRDRRTRTTHEAKFGPGTTILLFTDGLVERRDEDISDGMAALARAVDEHRDADLTALVRLIINQADAASHQDDTVVFALRIPERSS